MTTTIPSAPSDLTIPVQGMTCAACSARIQRALERAPGVSTANVNLMTGAATVSYDPSTITPERLVETIRDTGYGAALPDPGASAEALADTQDAAREAELRNLRWKLIASLVAAVLAMLISMPLAELVGQGTPDPLMRLMMPLTRPASNGGALDRPGPGRRVALDAAGAHRTGGGLGRPALLHQGLGGVPSSQRRHEHAHRGRHRRGAASIA